MSPKRGDRVTVPPPDDEWDIRFGASDAVKGWEELCRHALGNTRRCFEVTSGGRVRYAIDDASRTVWIVYASPRHPKDTDG